MVWGLIPASGWMGGKQCSALGARFPLPLPQLGAPNQADPTSRLRWIWVCLKNSVPLNPMVLLIIIPIKWLFHWEYTLFSDKPIWNLTPEVADILVVERNLIFIPHKFLLVAIQHYQILAIHHHQHIPPTPFRMVCSTGPSSCGSRHVPGRFARDAHNFHLNYLTQSLKKPAVGNCQHELAAPTSSFVQIWRARLKFLPKLRGKTMAINHGIHNYLFSDKPICECSLTYPCTSEPSSRRLLLLLQSQVLNPWMPFEPSSPSWGSYPS